MFTILAISALALLLFSGGKQAPLDKATENMILTLHPLIRDRVRKCIAQSRALGIKLDIDVALRSFAKQKQLYDLKKTDTLNSYHNYGFAIDVNSTQLKPGEIDKVAVIFKNEDFSWGGDWTAYKEVWHFEWKQKTKDELYSLLQQHKFDNNGYVII